MNAIGTTTYSKFFKNGLMMEHWLKHVAKVKIKIKTYIVVFDWNLQLLAFFQFNKTTGCPVQKLMHRVIPVIPHYVFMVWKRITFTWRPIIQMFQSSTQVINLAAFRWFVIIDLQVLVHCKCSEVLYQITADMKILFMILRTVM